MKFHRILVKNINSLYGTQTVDFDEQFDDVPLYLIMGPTGSGKTTILDAVCLALFGTTPRQEDASGGASGIGARVNSHGTGTSRAEVEFSIVERDGQTHGRTRYRAVWAFRRAYEEPDGRPQDPRRELKKKNGADDWEVVVSSDKQKKYEPAFAQVLDGMELNDFLRSIMLAQGEFDELLTADHDEKATILERLTDTSEYKKLGRRAHERYREERDEKNRLEEQIENFDGASEDEIEAQRRKLDDQRDIREELTAWRDTAGGYLEWLTDSQELDDKLDQARETLEAAEAKKEDHAEDFARLKADDEAKPAREPLGDVRRLEGDIASIEDQLPELEEALAEGEKQLEAAEETLDAQTDALEEAEAELDEQKPAIEKGKKLKVQLDGAKERRDTLKTKVTDLEKERKTRKEAVEKAKKAREAAKEAFDEAKNAYEETPEAAKLENQLTGLEAERKNVADQADRVAELEEGVDELVADIDRKTDALKAREDELDKKQKAAEPLEETLNDKKERLDEHLDGADGPQERRDQLHDSKNAAKTAKSTAESLAEKAEKRARLRDDIGETGATLEEAVAELESADETVESLEARVERLDEQIERRSLELKSVDLRRELEAGEECPVCGSREHPDLDGHRGDDEATVELDDEQEKLAAERDKLRAERNEVTDKLQEAEQTLQTHRETKSSLETELEKLGEDEKELEAAIDADVESLEDSVGEWFEVDLETTLNAETARAAVEACTRRLAELDEHREQLDAAEKAFESARDDLEEAEKKIEELEQARQKAADELENLEERNEEKLETLDDEKATLEEARRELRGKFDADGITVPKTAGSDDGPTCDFGRALKKARERVEAWKEAKQEKEDAREALDEADDAVDDAAQALGSVQEKLNEESNELEDVEQTATELKGELDDLLDGRDPEEVEEELEAAVKDAREAEKKARETKNEADKAVSKAENDLQNAEERRKEYGEDLEDAEQRLEDAIEGIDEFDSPQEVEAAILDDEEREKLRETRNAIEEALRDARRDLEAAETEREEHDEAKPAGLAPETHAVETLEGAAERLESAVNASNQRVGRMEQRLEQMEESREEFKQLERDLEEQKETFETWKQLNSLIGVRNGDQFKEFAQALNLDRIVKRANRRLDELHGRYQLQTRRDDSGLPTLDFEVIDRHHSGRARPLSTLSGGETFLVSLALALALADQQQLEMPIETLFLDEGFGTLDQDSLQNAVDILKNLRVQADSERTVGVISHVEALQEQISEKIVVDPQQNGRSKIKIPEEPV